MGRYDKSLSPILNVCLYQHKTAVTSGSGAGVVLSSPNTRSGAYWFGRGVSCRHGASAVSLGLSPRRGIYRTFLVLYNVLTLTVSVQGHFLR